MAREEFFFAPNIEVTHKIVDEIRALGIEDRHIHVLTKRDTPLEDLPEVSEFQKTDFIPAVERGAALGAATGLLAGVSSDYALPGLLLRGPPFFYLFVALTLNIASYFIVF